MRNENKGFDMAHLKVVLEQLAYFHAQSYHFINNYTGGEKTFKKDFWTMNGTNYTPTDIQQDLVDTMSETFYKTFETMMEAFLEDKENLERVKRFGKVRKEHVAKVNKPSETGFNCLIHNDAWINNFMFRHSLIPPNYV